jgi:signal transduction histidine kinase
VANVSHDLRTPIASLQGYLETLLIKEDVLSVEERRQYLGIALRHSERLGKLVAELFELAKLDSGHTELHREAFAPGELVQDVVLKYQLPAQREGVSIEARIPPDLPFVNADIGLIERVLENLLDNAIRHTPYGGRVAVSLAADAGRVAVQVTDTGCGIPAEELPYVFDRFYQVKKSEREASGGVGLGLAIAKRILDLHASTIAVASSPQSGTRFDFALPVYV